MTSIHSALDRRLERHEFNVLDVLQRLVDASGREVGVGIGIAMTREMFRRREHATLVRAINVGADHRGYLLRVFAEGTRVDDGICGVGIHIRVGKEIPFHADGARFFGGDASEVAREVRVVSGSEGHGVRETSNAIEAHGEAALKVGSDEQGKLGVAL